MQVTEVAELERLVRQSRLEFHRQQAVHALNSEQHQHRGQRKQFATSTPFGKDLTVARLFTSSPPPDTFTIANDVVDVDANRPQQRHNVDPRTQQNPTVQPQVRMPMPQPQTSPQPLMFAYHPVEETKNVSTDPENNEQTCTKSALSQIIRVKSSTSGKMLSGPALTHTIFLPDRTPFQVEVAMQATVEETIYAAIERHIELTVSAGRRPALFLNPKVYELRLHEADGMPDEDFPSLDRSRMIKNFCDLPSGGEYCLSFVPGGPGNAPRDPTLVSRVAELQAALARKRRMQKGAADPANEHVNQLTAVLQNDERVALQINIPEINSYTVVGITKGMKTYEVLAKVQAKQRLPLYSEEYQLILSEKDRNRVSVLSCVIEMTTDMSELHARGVRQIELRRRKFADAPAPLATPRGTQGGYQQGEGFEKGRRKRNDSVLDRVAHKGAALLNAANTGNVFEANNGAYRQNPEHVVFNELTAAVYQEWDVIKTNKWSKRQKRVMGIDSQKIYNKSKKEGGILPVKKAERLITDVLGIEPVANRPSCFRIKWRDAGGGESCVLSYEAEGGPVAAAEIISKIKYIKTHR